MSHNVLATTKLQPFDLVADSYKLFYSIILKFEYHGQVNH